MQLTWQNSTTVNIANGDGDSAVKLEIIDGTKGKNPVYNTANATRNVVDLFIVGSFYFENYQSTSKSEWNILEDENLPDNGTKDSHGGT